MIALDKKIISNIFIFISIVLGLIAYEGNLYYLGFYNLLIILQLIFVFLSVYLIGFNKININGYFWVFIVFYYFSFLISVFYNLDYLSLFRFILFPFVFIISFFISGKLFDYFKYFVFCNIFPAFVVFLIFLNGPFLFWDLKYGRGTSIYFDSNFCATILGLSAFISLIIFRRWGVVLFLIFLSSMFFTYSKSAIVAAGFAILFFLFLKYKFYISIILVGFTFSILSFLYNILDLNMFRIEQGMNSRDGLWSFAYYTIFNQGNFLGIGASNLERTLLSNGFENSSTHNNFMDILLQFGILPFVMIIFLSGYTLLYGLISRNILTSIFVFLIIMSSTITFTVGGLGLLSVVYTVVMVSILTNRGLDFGKRN